MSGDRIKQKFENLRNALNSLQQVLSMPIDENRIVLDATLQRFEFTFELFWKLLKVILQSQGINAATPKEVLKEAYGAQWITDEKVWLSMLQDRNTSSHVYNEKIAREIHDHAKEYYVEMQKLYGFLNNKFNT